MTSDAPAWSRASIWLSTSVLPRQGSSGLGLPMRELRPAAVRTAEMKRVTEVGLSVGGRGGPLGIHFGYDAVYAMLL